MPAKPGNNILGVANVRPARRMAPKENGVQRCSNTIEQVVGSWTRSLADKEV